MVRKELFNIGEGDLQIVDCLLKNGANIDERLKDGTSPLHLAASSGHTEIVETLLKHGASANVKKHNGASPLHEAASTGCSESVKLLLEFGARVNSTDTNERTALHYACSAMRPEATEMLINFGSDINLKNKKGFTAFDEGAESFISKSIGIIHFRWLRIVIHHIIKMKAANLYVCEENLIRVRSMRFFLSMVYIMLDKELRPQFTEKHFDCFEIKCLSELRSMRFKKIPYSNTSFYEILVKGESSLAAIMRNERAAEFLKTTNHILEIKWKFPIYAGILRSQIRKGMKRNNLVEPAKKSFNQIFKNFIALPYICIEKIFSNLSNNDLENLKDVFNPHLAS